MINYRKKKKNDKAIENAKNATPEEKAKVAEALKNDEGKTDGKTKIANGAITASATVGTTFPSVRQETRRCGNAPWCSGSLCTSR